MERGKACGAGGTPGSSQIRSSKTMRGPAFPTSLRLCIAPAAVCLIVHCDFVVHARTPSCEEGHFAHLCGTALQRPASLLHQSSSDDKECLRLVPSLPQGVLPPFDNRRSEVPRSASRRAPHPIRVAELRLRLGCTGGRCCCCASRYSRTGVSRSRDCTSWACFPSLPVFLRSFVVTSLCTYARFHSGFRVS